MSQEHAQAQEDPQTHLAAEPETSELEEIDATGSTRDAAERDGDMGVSSERVGPVAGGRGTIGTEPTYDDPAARPRSTGPNGSVPAPDEPIRKPPPELGESD